jgi:parallel beta-helix repeat protein
VLADEPVDSRLGGMAEPAVAGWGGLNEQTPIPTVPRVSGLPFLQELINAAPAGSVLKLKPGRYSGPVVVNKPLTIDGGGEASIDGGGKGTVFVLQANDAVLRDLQLTNSGVSHDSDDACLNVRGDRNVVENLHIDDCLFGIDLKMSNDNVLRGNRIRSKPFDLGTRGDSLRLWYSHRNLVADNLIEDSRDMVAWYSNENHYLNNVARRSRYSIHFMFAADNLVEGNRFYDNAVGVNVMYSGGGAIRNNLFSHANGPTGMAVGFKEASSVLVEGNEILYCAVGVGLDMSPFEPDTTITIRGNRIAYNGIGVSFLSDKKGTIIENNVLRGKPDPGGHGRYRQRQSQPLARQLLGRLSGFRPQPGQCRRPSARALRLYRPAVDGGALCALLPQCADDGDARFPRAPGAFFDAGDVAARRSAGFQQTPGDQQEVCQMNDKKETEAAADGTALPPLGEAKPVVINTRAKAPVRKQANRRKFIRSTVMIGGVLGLAMLGYLPVASARNSRLRPPGALEEKDFLSSCIKCGQCVQVCPVAAIKLDDIDHGFGVGVPYIDARDQACDFSCDAVQCILACPTGSLTYIKPAALEHSCRHASGAAAGAQGQGRRPRADA